MGDLSNFWQENHTDLYSKYFISWSHQSTYCSFWLWILGTPKSTSKEVGRFLDCSVWKIPNITKFTGQGRLDKNEEIWATFTLQILILWLPPNNCLLWGKLQELDHRSDYPPKMLLIAWCNQWNVGMTRKVYGPKLKLLYENMEEVHVDMTKGHWWAGTFMYWMHYTGKPG